MSLQEYIESLMEREQLSEEMKVKDPRSKEEIDHAKSLFNLLLVNTLTHSHIQFTKANNVIYNRMHFVVFCRGR